MRFVLLAAILLQAGSEAAVRTPDNDRKAVESVEREWLAHVSDRAALERILGSDFQHPVPQGVVLTKQQHIEWAVTHPRPANRTARFEQLHVRVYGDTAIANGIVDQRDAAGGSLGRSLFTDVFVFRDGRWQAVNAQENTIRSSQ